MSLVIPCASFVSHPTTRIKQNPNNTEHDKDVDKSGDENLGSEEGNADIDDDDEGNYRKSKGQTLRKTQ